MPVVATSDKQVGHLAFGWRPPVVTVCVAACARAGQGRAVCGEGVGCTMEAGPHDAGRLPAEFVHLVRERTDIVMVVAERVPLRPAGREFVGLCPFHEERTPSFYVNGERQAFHCHGCHEGGDVITFVMRMTGVTFVEAVADLAARVGLRVPTARPLSAAQRHRLAEQQELLAACEAAAAFFAGCLRSARGAPAIAYLRRRGVDARTAEQFRLGYAPSEWSALTDALRGRFAPEVLVRAGLAAPRRSADGVAVLRRAGASARVAGEDRAQMAMAGEGPSHVHGGGGAGKRIGPGALRAAGVDEPAREATEAAQPSGPSATAGPAAVVPTDGQVLYDRFRGRLMFPIWDDRGRVTAFGGRALDPGERAKYLNSPETPLFSKRHTVYALHLARAAAARAGRLIVVEGYMDALTCHQFGFGETVASLGTALSAEQAGTIARTTECVTLAYDADTAGQAATERGLGLLQEAGARVEVVRLPAGQDPDELLRSAGRDAFLQAVERAEPLVRYLVWTALGAEGAGVQSPERRWALAQRLAPYLARMPEGVRQEYTEWVARELLLQPERLRRSLDRLTARSGEHKNSNVWKATSARVGRHETEMHAPSGAHAAEEIVLAALLRSAETLQRISPMLSIHEFQHPAHQALADWLLALGGREERDTGTPAAHPAKGVDGGPAPGTGDSASGAASGWGPGAVARGGSGESREGPERATGIPAVAASTVDPLGVLLTPASAAMGLPSGVGLEPAGGTGGGGLSVGSGPAQGLIGRSPGSRLLDVVEDDSLRGLIARLLIHDVPGGVEGVVDTCLATMRRSELAREMQRLQGEQRRLVAAGKGLEAPELRQLVTQMRELAGRLMELTAERAAAASARELGG